jgi:hypothetical protein
MNKVNDFNFQINNFIFYWSFFWWIKPPRLVPFKIILELWNLEKFTWPKESEVWPNRHKFAMHIGQYKHSRNSDYILPRAEFKYIIMPAKLFHVLSHTVDAICGKYVMRSESSRNIIALEWLWAHLNLNRYLPPIQFLNQCSKQLRVEWLGLLLVNVFPFMLFHELRFCDRWHKKYWKSFWWQQFTPDTNLEWNKRFKNGWNSTDYNDRSGGPSTDNKPEDLGKSRNLFPQDPRLSIQDLCNTLGPSYGTCKRFFFRGIEHEEDCGEVCATTAAKWTDVALFGSVQGTSTTASRGSKLSFEGCPWVHPTSFSSPRWKSCWRGEAFIQPRKFMRKRRTY